MQTQLNTQNFNSGWLFNLADDPTFSSTYYNDDDWRQLHLPHDWSVEFSFDAENGDGATAYLLGGIAWYRKHFTIQRSPDQQVYILFDGVYNNCEVWCNGQPIGRNPYGYSPFWFDLTPYLDPKSDEQVLAVRVDHSRYIDSRWYTGSGIYRNVKLITKSKLHIPIWGTFLTTPVISETHAQADLQITIRNDFDVAQTGVIETKIFAGDGQYVTTVKTEFAIVTNQAHDVTQHIDIDSPTLWHPDNPALYRAVTSIYVGDVCHETYETPFGIRSIRFDSREGFFLNDENTLIKGVCLHHDAGLVGAAVPDRVWRRRLLTLKAMGCNAIRTAHNPSSEAFLDLCDELGFLVQVEFFDEWDNPKDKRLNKNDQHDDYLSRSYTEHFEECAEDDLKRTMLRDRNHPCVFQWSIGNEIEWTYPRYENATGYFGMDSNGNYFWTVPPYSADKIKAIFEDSPPDKYVLAETAHKLANWTRELDTTRPVVSNCILPSASHVTGYADALDIVGYSYRQVIYDLGHDLYPDKVIMGTENLGQWHEWKHVIERPFISGIFVWTGIHYLGEAHGRWPQKALACGMIDLAGFPEASYHMFKSLWTDTSHIHIATQVVGKSPYHLNDEGLVVEDIEGQWQYRLWEWHEVNEHWNYQDGELVTIEVYTNCETVELFLNNESLGMQYLNKQDDHVLKWIVPFASGQIEARGTTHEGQLTTTQLQTAGEPTTVHLDVDQTILYADGYDVAHVVAQLLDDNGNPVRHVERELVFSVDGVCKVLGVDNGSIRSVQDYQSNRVVTAQGRALLIVQAMQEAGSISIRADSVSLASDTV